MPQGVLGSILMDTITTESVLTRGAKYHGSNDPLDLARRVALAGLLVDNRVVKSIDAAILAFRIWAMPESREHPASAIIALANEKVKNAKDSVYQ